MKVGLYCEDLSRPDGMTRAIERAARAFRGLGHDVDVLSGKATPSLAARTARYDVFINNLPGAFFPSLAKRSWLWVHALPSARPRYLELYDVLANSEYTRREIRRRWGRRSVVLYPPADLPRPLRKEPMILSVGTFGAAARPKRELELIRLFKRLHRVGSLPGWSYHLAGADEGGRAWLSRLRREADGAPVTLHVEPRPSKLAELYGRASLLWHACREEHFGLAVVEAMGAGCLPLAFRVGGPSETVRHGKTGWLYSGFDELAELTVSASQARSLRGVRRAAAARGRRYDTAAFKAALCRLGRSETFSRQDVSTGGRP